MKKVKFTHFRAENFGKFREPIQHELGNRVLISGANGVGKSTLKRMIMYVIGTKDENGKEISGIRPHDENGVDIDGLTTVAELAVSVDGLENTLKRTCFQEKNREGKYTGKDNLQYFVDDVKKGTKKAYDEFVSTIIPNPVCISAYELLSKETETRRKILEDTFSTHSNDDVIDMHPEYEELRPKLKANTVQELRSADRKKINGETKGGKKILGLKDDREKIINQIEFEQSQKVDIDLAELELLKNALNEQIAENKAKQDDVGKQFEECDKLTDEIVGLMLELSVLERKANEELVKQRNELQSQIHDKSWEIPTIKKNIQKNNERIAQCERIVEDGEKERKKLLSDLDKVNSEEFDEQAAICPTCNRRLPEYETEIVKKDFEEKKQKRIDDIISRGLDVRHDIDSAKEIIQRLQQHNEDHVSDKEKLEKEITDLEQQLSALPQSIDISDREDVKQLKQQIAEKEAAMQKGNSASEIRQQLQDEREELQRQLNEVQKQFDKAEENNRIDERVAELKKQQLALSQEIADIERELDLLKQFERKKAELLEADVNENFDLVQFRMFEKMVGSDDLRDVCQILIGGESYDRNLNFSNKILAETDICRGFQKHYGIVAPILADNTESVDNDRIPQVENQLILFKRTDDKELKIECLEG